MFCENCGKRVDEGALFCENCGAKLNQRAEMNMQQHIPNVSDYVAGEKKQKSNMLPVIIVIVVFVMVFILAIAGITFMRMNRDKQQDQMNELYSIVEEEKEEEEKEEYYNNYDVEESDDYYDISEYEKPEYETEEDSYYNDGSEYIIYDSDSRYISKSELYGLSATECRLARNEIYARHGRMFDDEMLQSYFNAKSWYYPSIEPDDFKNSMLNKYEKANAETITEYEKEQGYR